MPQTKFGIVAGTPAPVAYVSLLGEGGENRAGSSGGQTSFTLPITPVVIAANESIFVGLVTVQNSDPSKNTGWVGVDNLGNIYIPPVPPKGQSGMSVGLLHCLDPKPGTLTSITVSWTGALTTDGCIAMRVVRFRNVGEPEARTPASISGSGWTTANFLLTAPASGPSDGIGISVYGCRTQGEFGDPYAPNGSVFLGSNASPATYPISNSSHSTVWMGYRIGLTTVGIGHSILTYTGSEWAHVAQAYKIHNEWG